MLRSPVQSPQPFKTNVIVPLCAILKKHFFDGTRYIYSVCKRTMLRCFCSYNDNDFVFQEICPPSLYCLLCLKGTLLGSNIGLLGENLWNVMIFKYIFEIQWWARAGNWNCSSGVRTGRQDDSLDCLNQGSFSVFILWMDWNVRFVQGLFRNK